MSAIQQIMLAGKALDLTPDAFSFTSQSGANPSTTATSDTVTLSGFDIPVSWSVSGGTASVGGAGYTTSGTISPGQTVVLSVVSSAGYSSGASATFTAGGVSGSFSVTTRATDTTPDAFSFTPQSNVQPSTVLTSNTLTLTGYETGVSWTCSGGTASISGQGYTTSGTIVPGQTVTLRVTSSPSFSGIASATFTAGGVSGTFTATTRAIDTTPNAFSFTSVSGVGPNAALSSNQITMSGFDGAVNWSCSGGQALVGGVWAYSGTITAGQTVTVSLAASPSYSTAKSTTFTAGGVSGTFTATTRAIDTTPNAFSFTNRTGQPRNTDIISNSVTITGFDGTLTWSGSSTATGDAGGSVDGGPFTASGTITAGQSLRLFCKNLGASTAKTTVTIGGTSTTWTVTTI